MLVKSQVRWLMVCMAISCLTKISSANYLNIFGNSQMAYIYAERYKLRHRYVGILLRR
jgi:hypothetical protein